MASQSKVKLAGVMIAIGLVTITGTNLAFAQQQPCGEQPYVYNVGCAPLGTAQLYAAALVGGIVAFAAACGAAGVRYSTIP